MSLADCRHLRQHPLVDGWLVSLADCCHLRQHPLVDGWLVSLADCCHLRQHVLPVPARPLHEGPAPLPHQAAVGYQPGVLARAADGTVHNVHHEPPATLAAGHCRTVDVARTVREARQSAGLSQRALAERSGVAARTVAAVESGERQPSLPILEQILGACGLSLTTTGHVDPAVPCSHLREHLRRSLTARWALAAAGTGRQRCLERALAAAAAVGTLVLEPTAAVPIWVPGVGLDLPVVLAFHPVEGLAAEPALPDVDGALLVVRRGPPLLPRGLVRVRVVGLVDVHVRHPAVLAREQCCSRWRPGLQAAAGLLHDAGGRDAAGRRAPAHRQPDEDEEAWRLCHALRYTGGQRPHSRDSRAFRLDAAVSLPQWLDERGLPPLRGQRGRW